MGEIKNEKIWFNVLATLLLLSCIGCSGNTLKIKAWQQKLEEDSQLFGHRNWIVIVDSAYPKQSNPGIETISTGTDHLEVLKFVIDTLAEQPHVNANIYLDAELDFVSNISAPGIEQYREELKQILKTQNINKLPHEEIIYKLDKAGETFNILILKTDFVLPYTSVFFELDCGYWDTKKGKQLRDAMELKS